MSGELAIGGGDELCSLLLVLADEQHERRRVAPGEMRVAPPPGEEGVVASKLLVVLVDPACAVVLDEQKARARRVRVASDLEHRVGPDGPWSGVAPALGRPVVVEAQLVIARARWRLDRRFAVPGEEVIAEGAAVG